MELMQLEMFVAVFEERSVQRAAERVCRTQPAVSIALGKLEHKIGSRLVERHRGNYQLTDAGKVLYEYASRIIGLRSEALSRLCGTNSAGTGRLCVGAGITEHALWLSQLACDFGKAFPNVRFEVLYDRRDVLVRNLVEGRIDLAFLPAPPEPNERNSNLVTLVIFVPTFGSGPRQPVWLVQQRIGCSYLAKSFEEMAVAFSKDSTRAVSHPQTRLPKFQVRKLSRRLGKSTAKRAAI